MTQVTKNRIINRTLVTFGFIMVITVGCTVWSKRNKPVEKPLTDKQLDKQIARLYPQPTPILQPTPSVVQVKHQVITPTQMDSLRRLTVAVATEEIPGISTKLDSINAKLDMIISSRQIRATKVDSMFLKLQKLVDSVPIRQARQISSLKRDVVVRDQTIVRNIYQQNKFQSALELIAAIVILLATALLARNIHLTSPGKLTNVRSNV